MDTLTDILTANLPIRNDPWYVICQRAMEDKRYERVRDQIIRGRRTLEEGRGYFNMDGGPFFHDTRAQSIITAPATAITLAATDKLLHPGSLTAVPAGYFIPGKKLRLTVFGTMTTAVTPGNLQIAAYVGSADAATTAVLPSSAAITLVASQSNISMLFVVYLKCNGGTVETAKPIEAYGTWSCGTALITAANQQAANPLPISAPAAVNIDNTSSTMGFNVQLRRSGSTAETFTTRDITLEALT